jgi:hypothetical protein
MAFQLSPGVNVSEIDLTTVVPSVATSDGAIAGVFRWGPVGERILVDTENSLVSRFGKPTNFNAETWFSAANFLSYANRLYVARAADTSGATPFVSANAAGGANSILNVGDTSAITVGMYVTQVGNNSVLTGNVASFIVVSKNSSHIVMNKNTASSFTNVNFYFGRPETVYTAVGFDPSNTVAKAANLVNQIVKNETHYAQKDGTFDTDVVYVAKFPGAIGNSLRVAVCDNADSFNSAIPLFGANTAGSGITANAVMEFRVGSNVATMKVLGSTNAVTNSVISKIAVGDQILAGNSTLGVQYLQVRSSTIAANTTAVTTFVGNTAVNSNINFISVPSNPFTNGDIVVYANSAGESEVNGLLNGTSYHVIQANSSGLKLSNNPFGTEIDLVATPGSNSVLTANYRVLSVQFEDPYRLRENYTTQTVDRYWEFFNVVETAPGQSNYVLFNGNTAASDELHVVVVDDGGAFTGTPGTVLEVYKGVSRATDAKNADNSLNYYKDVINQSSEYIWWANDRGTAPSANSLNLISATSTAPASIQLQLGADGRNENDASLGILGAAYDLFASPEDIDISLVLQGKPVGGSTAINGRTVQNFQLANYIIENICERRRDCVALISPDKSLVLNNVGNETTDLRAWRGAITSTSYAVLDSGWKYQYDRYNDLYRWVPLNGDIAGICVRTDNTNDAWWSPAGFNRGQIKNLVKLAWNPRKAERDVLYSNGVNPVVTFPGQGTILFGDKTLQAKPSAFDRINVRRLFIVLEKAISVAAKYQLFEFNDAFTRAQFRNLVIPYLRTIQGRRGITDFHVVCDDTNNTQQIIDSNQFVGDIYIKPARSINFIQLNFVAVPSGVQFSEVIGKF